LDALALLSRERAGHIIRPALLKTRSLAAELASAVKSDELKVSGHKTACR